LRLPRRWLSHLTGLLLWLALGALIGAWFGSIVWALFVALALYVVYTLHNLYLLDRMIFGAGRRMPLFDTRGLWAELVAGTDKIKVRARNRKKRHNQLLREVRESTSAINDAGIILNADSEIVWFNPAATRLLGLDPRRDKGSRIDNLLRHPDFIDYLQKPEGSTITIPTSLRNNGTLQVQLIPYGTEQRLLIIRDVTQATNLERMRQDFVANASHELRSPLTVIAGYLDALADDPELPESWEVPISEMLRQSYRMTQILKDLIELTRLESAESAARDDFVDVSEMLRDIVGEFETREKRPTLELHVDSDAAMLASESELYSVFFNLISNAVRFTPASGRVDIYWTAQGHEAVFEVADTGIGIPADLIPRLTERFYRVDTSRSRATGGTGLGLAIVKHALQRHDGQLKIESIEGKGSRFRCRFYGRRVLQRSDARGNVV
jgi:two-component system phosphate regulon sensor histidine kinase PhoR